MVSCPLSGMLLMLTNMLLLSVCPVQPRCRTVRKMPCPSFLPFSSSTRNKTQTKSSFTQYRRGKSGGVNGGKSKTAKKHRGQARPTRTARLLYLSTILHRNKRQYNVTYTPLQEVDNETKLGNFMLNTLRSSSAPASKPPGASSRGSPRGF